MAGRETDHANLDLAALHRDVIQGTSDGMIIWQPRIECWYEDREYRGEAFPGQYKGLDRNGIFRKLGCSHRNYEFNRCFKRIDDARIEKSSRKLSDTETENVMRTPVGTVNSIVVSNTSNPGTFTKKWWIASEEDMKVMSWIEERCSWEWDNDVYCELLPIWGDLGLPTMFMPRINIQHLYVDVMGGEEGIFAIYDYPGTVERYFRVLSENHERLIEVINRSPIEIINFGDNVHSGLLPPELFVRYALPEYQKRNEQLHKASKFTHPHWDGDTKPILRFARECGFDGVEAVTPKPQGDVTPEEIKEAFGDELFLLDGIAALLFEDSYPLEELEQQAKQLIELFAPKLILGISDEISSRGNLDRIEFVGKIVDDYNAGVKKN